MTMTKYVLPIALTLLLVLSGSAGAEDDALLVYMANGGNVPNSLIDHIQSATGDASAATVGDVKIALDGICYDGISLAAGWSFVDLQPDQTPALVIATNVRAAGQPVDSHFDFPLCQWAVPNLFYSAYGETSNTVIGGMSGQITGDAPDGAMRIETTFHILRPTKPLAVVDAALFESSTDEDNPEKMIEAFKHYDIKVADAQALNPDEWVSDGYAVIDRYGRFYVEGEFLSMYELHMTDSLMGGWGKLENPADEPVEVIAEVTLAFDATAEGATDSNIDWTPTTPIEMNGIQAHVTRLLSTPMAVYADIFFSPNEPAADAETVTTEIGLAKGWLQAADGEGNIVPVSAYDWLSNYSYSGPEELDDVWTIALHQVCAAPLDMPERLTLMPNEFTEGGSFLYSFCEELLNVPQE